MTFTGKNISGEYNELPPIDMSALLDSVAESIYAVDTNGQCTYCNASFLKTLGYKSPGEVIGKDIHSLIHHHREDGTPYPNHSCIIYEALKNGEGAHSDSEVFWKSDGRFIPVEYWAHPQSRNGQIAGNVVTFIDISLRKIAEAREYLRRTILELMYKGAPLPEILDKMILGMENERKGMMCSILILSNDGKYFSIGAGPHIPEFYNNAILKVEIGDGVGSCGTAAYTGKRVIVSDINTHPYWKEFKDVAVKAGLKSCWSEPIRDRNNKTLGAFAIYQKEVSEPTATDIEIISRNAEFAALVIQHYRDEQFLIQSEEKYRQIVETAQEGILVIDNKDRTSFVNQRMAAMLGYVREDMLGMHLFDFMDEEGKEKTREYLVRRREGISENFEFRFKKMNGEDLYALIETNPIMKEGEYAGALAMITDITERKKTEDALRENEERYRILVENAPEALVVIDMEKMKFISVSESAAVLFKLSKNELLDIEFLKLSPEFQPDGKHSSLASMEKLKEAIAGGKPTFEWMHCDSQGKLIPCEIRLVRLPAENKVLVRGSITDITERKNVELALHESEERYRGLLNNLDAGIVVHRNDTSIIMSNPKATDLLGLSSDQMLGKKAIDPEWKFLGEDNKPLSLEKYPVNQIISTRKPIKNFIAGVYRPETKDIVWLMVVGFPSFDSKGEINEIVISFIDITESKRIKEEQMESERFLLETQLIVNLGTYSFDFISNNWSSSEIFNKIFGIDSVHDMSLNGWLEMVHPQWRNIMHDYLTNEVLGKKRNFDKEYKIIRVNDKQERWIHGLGNNLKLDENGTVVSLVGTIRDITEKKSHEEEIIKSRQELRNLSAHLQTIREDEGARISREIHDELGQQLTGLKMDARWIGKKINQGDKALSDKVESMVGLIDETMKTLRRIASVLRPGILDDLGLVATLEWQINEFEKRTGIKCRFSCSIQEEKIDKDIKTGIFRVCQESLTNIARHANATIVLIKINEEKNYINLMIEDNGSGFDVSEIISKKSLGLIGMKERAIMIGGELIIKSSKGSGTVLTLKVPVEKFIAPVPGVE